MAEQQQEQQQGKQRSIWIPSDLKWTLIIMGTTLLLALGGVILGAINFMSGPVTYPGWLLAVWMVIDILLLVFLLLHLLFFGIVAASQNTSSTTESAEMGGVIGCALILLIGGWILIGGKHLAWVSLFEFFLLIGATILDTIIVVKMHED